MSRSQSVIVSGGIAAGVPFTLGSLTQISSTDPPEIADSVAFQRTQGGIEVITMFDGSWPLVNTFDEQLQVVGGIISDTGATGGVAHLNTIMGEGALAQQLANARNVVIGSTNTGGPTQAQGNANLTDNVVIGAGAAVGGTNTLGNNVVIGANARYAYSAGVQAGNNVIIGSSITVANFFDGVIIGGSAIISAAAGSTGVFIGRQVQGSNAVANIVAIGNAARVDASSTIALGDGARARAAVSIAIGRNADATVANGMVVGGQNVGIFDYLWGEGLLSGGASPDQLWHYSGSQGTDTPGADIVFRASIGTGNANTKGSIIFATGTPGATGVGGQTAANRLAVRTPQGSFSAAVDFLNTTDAAGAAAGTLTNAPTAGDPTRWLPVLIDGVEHYIPCWTWVHGGER